MNYLPAIAATVASFAAASAVSNATYSPRSQLFGRTIVAGPDPSEAAFTFDDGPNDVATLQLLDLFARYQARATFFMIGKFVRQRPEIVRAVHQAGHLIANHTTTHPWLTLKSASIIREELRGCNQALEDVIGAPVHYFRPPHGARRPAVLSIAREMGLKTVQWNVMGHDWEPIDSTAITAKLDSGLALARKRNTGANILLHDGFDKSMGADRSATVAATATLLERFQQNNTRIVTVDHWG